MSQTPVSPPELAEIGVMLLAGYSAATALTVSASLAQIGEFSVMVAALGTAHGLLSAEGQNLILAGAIISITLNPAVFRIVLACQRRLDRAQPV